MLRKRTTTGIRRSRGRRRASQAGSPPLTPSQTWGHPFPQSGGRQRRMGLGRLVRIMYVCCGVARVMSQNSGRQASASWMKKSLQEQVETCPGRQLQRVPERGLAAPHRARVLAVAPHGAVHVAIVTTGVHRATRDPRITGVVAPPNQTCSCPQRVSFLCPRISAMLGVSCRISWTRP